MRIHAHPALLVRLVASEEGTLHMETALISHKLRWVVLAAVSGLAAAFSSNARASVNLSFTDCSTLKVPTISTSDYGVLGGPYRLRCKVIDGSPYGFHAATSFENNGYSLDQLPPRGYYDTAALYYITYSDSTHSTIVSIGPETDVPLRVTDDYYYSTYTFGGTSFNNYPVGMWGNNFDDYGQPGPVRVSFDVQLQAHGSVYSPSSTITVKITDSGGQVVWSSASAYVTGNGSLVFNNMSTPGASVPNSGVYNISVYVTSGQSYGNNYTSAAISNVRVSRL
jgi:hypothetical protein